MAGKGVELVERSGSKAEVKGEASGAAHVPPAPRGIQNRFCCSVGMQWDKNHVINSRLERGRAGKS